MSITFNPSNRIFTLNTAHTTYQMQADAPQAKPGGGEDKKAGDNGDQP